MSTESAPLKGDAGGSGGETVFLKLPDGLPGERPRTKKFASRTGRSSWRDVLSAP